jgi:hypothetical protein
MVSAASNRVPYGTYRLVTPCYGPSHSMLAHQVYPPTTQEEGPTHALCALVFLLHPIPAKIWPCSLTLQKLIREEEPTRARCPPLSSAPRTSYGLAMLRFNPSPILMMAPPSRPSQSLPLHFMCPIYPIPHPRWYAWWNGLPTWHYSP